MFSIESESLSWTLLHQLPTMNYHAINYTMYQTIKYDLSSMSKTIS